MPRLNNDIQKIIHKNEFFAVSQIVKEYTIEHPHQEIVSLGIGDVSFPIVKPVIDVMHKAVDDLANPSTFKGYGPSHGYDFLKEKILANDYSHFDFTKDELYISNGTKTDATSILELFDLHAKIAVTNPLYPIYKNGAICLNRDITFLKTTEEEQFIPSIPKEKWDIVYLCSPNNPTGIAYSRETLKKWIDYAIENDTVILYDNVYHSFILSQNVPKTIYEIDGAKQVAIEFRSFSKDISFTGVRCSYYLIPNEIATNINSIWKNRTINRFNGADYIAQKGAAASYSKEAKEAIRKNINDYLDNAQFLKQHFLQLGYKVYGGEDSPFLWVKCKNDMKSMDVFHFFLKTFQVVIVPGIVFGEEGDSYFRVSSLGKREILEKAIERIEKYDKKI